MWDPETGWRTPLAPALTFSRRAGGDSQRRQDGVWTLGLGGLARPWHGGMSVGFSLTGQRLVAGMCPRERPAHRPARMQIGNIDGAGPTGGGGDHDSTGL